MTHASPSLDQDSFRGRNDDGSESAATWKAAVNTNWTQAVDENFRVRQLVQEVNGAGENKFNARHQYNRNGLGWNDVTATSLVVRASASPHFADEAATTQQLGAGPFVIGAMDEDNGLAGSGNQIDLAGSDETEVEYCCQIRGADVANGDTVELRVVRDGGTLETWTNTPSITVSAATVVTVGLATETDTALGVSAAKSKAVGLATSPETAPAVTAAQGRTVVVGLAISTEIALAVSSAKAKAVSQAISTEIALAVSSAKAKAVSQAISTEIALAVGAAKALAIGQALETDSALAVAAAKALPIGIAIETDSALPVIAALAAAAGGAFIPTFRPRRR